MCKKVFLGRVGILFILGLVAFLVIFLFACINVIKEPNRVHPSEYHIRTWIEQSRGVFNKESRHSRHISSVFLRQASKFKEEDLLLLKSLPKLTKLDLSYSSITDDAIPYINELESLKVLDLSGTNITDAGFVRLSLPNLRMLRVDNTAITSEGDRGLEERCPNLEFMSIGNTPLHDKAQQASPVVDNSAEEDDNKNENE